MTNAFSENDLLRDRIREQEQALADLAIERRNDKLTITMLRLHRIELEASLDRTREAVERREEQIEDLERRLRRALLASSGAQRALNRLRQQVADERVAGRNQSRR
ncbi:MAG: hypothetical protein ACYC28_14325 [Longimicrobiales bacterium]